MKDMTGWHMMTISTYRSRNADTDRIPRQNLYRTLARTAIWHSSPQPMSLFCICGFPDRPNQRGSKRTDAALVYSAGHPISAYRLDRSTQTRLPLQEGRESDAKSFGTGTGKQSRKTFCFHHEGQTFLLLELEAGRDVQRKR